MKCYLDQSNFGEEVTDKAVLKSYYDFLDRKWERCFSNFEWFVTKFELGGKFELVK